MSENARVQEVTETPYKPVCCTNTHDSRTVEKWIGTVVDTCGGVKKLSTAAGPPWNACSGRRRTSAAAVDRLGAPAASRDCWIRRQCQHRLPAATVDSNFSEVESQVRRLIFLFCGHLTYFVAP